MFSGSVLEVTVLAALTMAVAITPSRASGSVDPGAPLVRGVGADSEMGGLVEWMLGHPDDVSIVVTGGSSSGDLRWNAEVERPLGSTFKTIVLAGYAREVAASRVDPDDIVPLEDVERWLVEGTDGGSHALMVQRQAPPDGLRVDDLAAAMMAYSANTATDELLDRLGRNSIVETMDALGLPQLAVAAAPPAGVLGLFRDEALGSTTAARVETLRTMDGSAANIAAWQQFAAFAADPRAAADTLAALSELTSWENQLQLTDAMPWRARPADMHHLLVRLLTERALGPAATSIIEQHMSWPMNDPTIAAHFTDLAAKEGAAPGTLVVHGRGTPRTGSAAGVERTIVVSVHNLDAESWVSFFESDAAQALGMTLIDDPAFVAELGRALSR